MIAVLALLPVLLAQAPVPAPARFVEEVSAARLDFRKGNFREAISLLDEAARSGRLGDPKDRAEAERLQALCHLYLGERAEAMAHLEQVLLDDPDFDLDPLTYGAEAKRTLEETRASPELKPRLDERRRQLAEEAERQKQAEAARRQAAAPPPASYQVMELHSAGLNFLPFGVPQVDQGRPTAGMLFGIAQGVSVAATVLTYTQVRSLIESDGKVLPDNLSDARAWRLANWISMGVLVALYTGGVADAFLHFEGTRARSVTPEEFKDIQRKHAPAAPRPSATFLLTPLPDGACAAIGGHF